MKTFTKTLLCVCGILLFPLILSAAKDQKAMPEYDLKEYKHIDLTLPIPTKVVAPRIRSGQVGQETKMLFTVTHSGRAIHIHSSKPFSDSADLTGAMSQVIRKWEFEPARDENGIAHAVKVSMPVKVIKEGDKTENLVRLSLAKPIFLARVN